MTAKEITSYTNQVKQAMLLARGAQILKDGETPTFAALPFASYQSMLELLEDMEDALLLDEARHEDDGSRISLAQAKKLLEID